MNRVSYGQIRKSALAIVAVSHLIVFVFSTSVSGAALSKQAVEQTLKETMKTVLTGQTIKPALQQKIDTIKAMVASDALSQAELEATTKAVVIPLFDEIRTSRYILKELPEVVDDILSPAMNWEKAREIIWDACSSVIKEGDEVVFTIGTLAPDGTPWLSVPRSKLVPDVKRLSNGKVQVKIYGGGIMGEDTDILRKMDIGQLEGCGCTALGVLKASPKASVFLLPGLFNNYDEIDYIFKKFRKTIDAAFEERGYILAALIDTGYFHFFSKKKITDLASIRKQKVLTWFGQVETTLYEHLGINATPVAVPEVVSALSTGLAETNLAPSAWMLGMQAYQYANYYVEQPFLYSPAAVIISMDTKHRLEKKLNISPTYANNMQELLVFEVNSLEKEWREKIRSYESRSLEAFVQKCGMKGVSLPAEDMKALETAGVKVQQDLAGKIYSRELLDDVLAALEEYRANNPE